MNCLFVGGHADGRRVNVPEINGELPSSFNIAITPIRESFCTPQVEPPILNPMTYECYVKRFIYDANGEYFIVYTDPSMSSNDLIARLIRDYPLRMQLC